ncbi:MAG: hypothetical protein P8R54_26855 [Myxococcota bacterium]|nr:hypothetical protein [Myxococcota bacterium]
MSSLPYRNASWMRVCSDGASPSQAAAIVLGACGKSVPFSRSEIGEQETI